MIKGVHGFTSDGIELETNVNVIFTLGQPPEVMTVFDTKENGLRDHEDQSGIPRKYPFRTRSMKRMPPRYRSNIQNQKPNRNAAPAFEQFSSNRPPYVFEEEHIISAVISQPRNTKDGKLEKWTDLPAQVAVSVLLDELSQVVV